jgi:hypothetical protein
MSVDDTEYGNCYLAALTVLNDFTSFSDKQIRLCHGYATIHTGEFKGDIINHAWVEIKDPNNNMWYYVDISPTEFDEEPIFAVLDATYKLFSINPDTLKRYNRKLANALFKKHKHYGPWDIPAVNPDGVPVDTQSPATIN